MKAWTIGVLIIGAAISIGCSSMKSTMLARNESNTDWCKVKHLQGVPITLKVPTHLRIYIYQKHFMEQVTVGGVSKWQMVAMPAIYDFGSEALYTDQIFTTDFKRPAAGAFNLDLEMTEDQYVERVQQDITDETLSEIGNLIDKLPGLFVPAAGGATQASSGEAGESLKEIKSVVAAGVFEVNAPDFEIQVENFVQSHLNHRSGGIVSGFSNPHIGSSAQSMVVPTATVPPAPAEQPTSSNRGDVIRMAHPQSRFSR